MKYVIAITLLIFSFNVFGQREDTLNILHKTTYKNYVLVFECYPDEYFKKNFEKLFNEKEKQQLLAFGFISFNLIIDIDSGNLIELFSHDDGVVEDALLLKVNRIFVRDISFKIYPINPDYPPEKKYLHLCVAMDLTELNKKKGIFRKRRY